MTILKSKSKYIWLILLLLVLLSNTILYNTQIGKSTLPTNSEAVVLGSLLDLIIIAPITFLLYKKSFSWKWFIGLMATGCMLALSIIPSDYLQPFHAITWSGIVAEGALFLIELSLIVTFVRYIPKIIKDVKISQDPLLFSFPQAVEKYVKKNPLIFAICMELLMYYFALASWKKNAPTGFTLYKNSSIIPFQIMILHAIVIETVGIHWLLHILHVPLWVSIILLLANIYGVIFILGDLQALRLNPVQFKNGSLYISQGIMKKVVLPLHLIDAIETDGELLKQKLSKDTLPFIVVDFEKVHPNVILKLKEPIKASLIMGIEREYNKIAIKLDEPIQFIEKIKNHI